MAASYIPSLTVQYYLEACCLQAQVYERWICMHA